MVLCTDSYYLLRDGDVDILVPPDAGPQLGHGGHRGRDHGTVVVRVTGLRDPGLLTRGGGGGGERGRGWGQVIIAAVHCCRRRRLLHVSAVMLQGLSFTAWRISDGGQKVSWSHHSINQNVTLSNLNNAKTFILPNHQSIKALKNWNTENSMLQCQPCQHNIFCWVESGFIKRFCWAGIILRWQ